MAHLRILTEIPGHPFQPGDVVDADLVDHPSERVRDGSAQWSNRDGSPADPPTDDDPLRPNKRTALRAEPRETTAAPGGEENTARSLQAPDGLSTSPPKQRRRSPAKDKDGDKAKDKDGDKGGDR